MTGGKCSDGGCCVFPITIALVAGAFLRQIFSAVRNSQPWLPSYTVALFTLGMLACIFDYSLNHAFEEYISCMQFTPRLMYIMLPLLVFEATFCVETQAFKRSLNQVMLLALVNYSLMITLTAAMVVWLFEEGWDWHVALMFGAVVCATDSLAVDDTVRVPGVSPDMESLLHGESVLSSSAAVVMFRLFSLLGRDTENNQGGLIAAFVVQTMFALLIGLGTAVLTVNWLSRIFNEDVLEITIVLSVAHLIYFAVELMDMPGILTVTVFGLYLSSCRTSISRSVEDKLRKFIRIITEIFNSVAFLYAGTEMGFFDNESHRSSKHDFMLFLAIVFFRGFSLFFLSPMLRKLGYEMSWEHTMVVWQAALNGAFNLLLGSAAYVHAVPSVSHKFLDHVISVVMLKQVFNTGITRTLLKIFGTRTMPGIKRTTLLNVFRMLKDTRFKAINALKSDRFMADAVFDIVETYTAVDPIMVNLLPPRKSKVRTKTGSVYPAMSDNSITQLGSQQYETMHILMNGLKKTYTRAADRGLLSKEALYQLQKWIDEAVSYKGGFIDVRQVKKSSEVTPYLKKFKRQIQEKLAELGEESEASSHLSTWTYFQRHWLPKALSYGFHLVDVVMVPVAVVVELKNANHTTPHIGEIYNFVVVSLYGMITLGELLVRRRRFFKVVWHNIDFLIVVMGVLDILVLHAVRFKTDTSGLSVAGATFIRICFILSRLVRVLSLVEISPFVLKKMLRMVEKRISHKLGVGFEICCAFVTGQVEVARQIDNLLVTNREQLRQECHRQKLIIIRTLGILQQEHPTIALSVKTKLALHIVLNAQHEAVNQLRAEGVLIGSDYELLIKGVEERMKILNTRPPLVEDKSVDSIISNISWAQGDSDLQKYLKAHRHDINLRANSVLIEQGANNHDICAIRSGVIRLELKQADMRYPVVDFLTAGNIIGETNFLTKQSHKKTVRCETAVSVMIFREHMIEKALSMAWNPSLPPLLYRLWLALAKRVAVKVFMKEPQFERMSKDRILMHLADAYILDSADDTIIDITADITDIVLVFGDAIDTITRQPFRGPCYVPITTVQLKLQPEKGLYTLVLLVPRGPPPQLTYSLSPGDRKTRLDSAAFAVSSSTEGLKVLSIAPSLTTRAAHKLTTPEDTFDTLGSESNGSRSSSKTNINKMSKEELAAEESKEDSMSQIYAEELKFWIPEEATKEPGNPEDESTGNFVVSPDGESAKKKRKKLKSDRDTR